MTKIHDEIAKIAKRVSVIEFDLNKGEHRDDRIYKIES
jgi:hypothetical protein